jgi:hypothetical protein
MRPPRFNLPDLSELNSDLTAKLMLNLILGRSFPPGDAQHLVTSFVRLTESALRRYEEARLRLGRSAGEGSLVEYVRGQDDMELALIVLHRAMRHAVALKQSRETKVGKTELPDDADRERLRRMRNAIDHGDSPIVAGLAGKGQILALSIRENDMTIEDDKGTLTATHEEVGGWVRSLHGLAVDVISDPERWIRT